MTDYIITISREFGSGGREIGKKLAEKLNIPFYDKNVNEFTAIKTGFSNQTIENSEDKTPGAFTYGMFSYVKLPPLHDEIFYAQSEVIRNLAKKGPCVIVGRCADYVLNDRKNVLTLFIFAPKEERIKRIMKVENVDEEQAKRMIRHYDKLRKRYHEHYAQGKWGEARNYHLTINSAIDIDNVVEALARLVVNLNAK